MFLAGVWLLSAADSAPGATHNNDWDTSDKTEGLEIIHVKCYNLLMGEP